MNILLSVGNPIRETMPLQVWIEGHFHRCTTLFDGQTAEAADLSAWSVREVGSAKFFIYKLREIPGEKIFPGLTL
jgi:hypothetical protein